MQASLIHDRAVRYTSLLLMSIILLFLRPDVTLSQLTNNPAPKTREQAWNDLNTAFEEGNYDKTMQLVERFRHDFPKSKKASSVSFITAQSALKLRLLDIARLETRRIMLKFPDSDYVDDARMILAQCDILSENWDDAREHLGWILGFSQDRKLMDAARMVLEEMNQFLELKSGIEMVSEVAPSLRPKIGLILPLSQSEDAKAFLSGFRARWDASGAGELIIHNSEGDPIRAVRLAQMLARQERVWCLVGGLDPAEAVAVAATAEMEKVPFLSCVCGANNLSAVGRYVFQGRADYHGIGKALGKYAMQNLGLVHFGILAPVSQSGKQIARGFKEAVDYAGGEILAEEAYYPGSNDFSMQLKRIREIGLRRAYDDSLRNYFSAKGHILMNNRKFSPDSSVLQPVLPPEGLEFAPDEDTTWTLSGNLLDSLWDADRSRLRKWMTETKQEIDSLEIPLEVYDGFLLIVELGAIEIMAPQFARFNLQTQLLGDENWADRDAIFRVSNYVEGMVFAEPLAVRGGEEYYQFAALISGIDSSAVSVHHLAGERAARMAVFAASRANNAESMRIALSQIRDLQTVSGRVSLLKEERVDRHVTLMQYQYGEYEVVSE
ncbi:amino acid ABC transporter substrate-binding protein [bacterium]|nr:amino acid ABC transporter substrate-binding protein [bacterium]